MRVKYYNIRHIIYQPVLKHALQSKLHNMQHTQSSTVISPFELLSLTNTASSVACRSVPIMSIYIEQATEVCIQAAIKSINAFD